MSRSQQPRLVFGATPGKLALIVILSLVMVGVIASNWPSAAAPLVDETASADQPQPPVAAATAETTQQPAASVSPFAEFAEDQHWPERPLQEVTEFDPLAVSDWAQPPAAAAGGSPAQTEQQIHELLGAQNAIIFVAGDKRIARIGDKQYNIGDAIGRYTIRDITAKGVVLSEDR